MGSESINVESIAQFKECLNLLEDELIPNFKMVANDVVEAAEYTNIPNLVSSSKTCEESAQAVLKVLEQSKELLKEYITKYEKIAAATGAM